MRHSVRATLRRVAAVTTVVLVGLTGSALSTSGQVLAATASTASPSGVAGGYPPCNVVPGQDRGANAVPPGPPDDPSVPHCLGPAGLSATVPGNHPISPSPGGSPAEPVNGNCYPTNCSLFNGQRTTAGGHQGSWASIQMRAGGMPNYNLGTFRTGWVMDAHGNNWTQVGWIQGNIGGNCGTQTYPVVWLQVNNNGNIGNTYCFPGYALTRGAYYQFATVTTAGGDCWSNEIYWAGAWNILNGTCYTTPNMTANNADAEQAFEFSAPTNNGPFPVISTTTYVTNGKLLLNGGNWQAWTTANTAVNSDAMQIGQYQGYAGYYTGFHTSRTVPDFSVSASPSSISVLPGQSGSSTISTATNLSYDGLVLDENTSRGGYISYSTSGVPSGSSASVNPTTLSSPRSSSTYQSTLTVNVGLLQLSSFTVTVHGCGYSGCHTTYVTVNPL